MAMRSKTGDLIESRQRTQDKVLESTQSMPPVHAIKLESVIVVRGKAEIYESVFMGRSLFLYLMS